MMINKKRLRWIFGAVTSLLMSLLVTLAYYAITWVPLLSEIASVTWNDRPPLG